MSYYYKAGHPEIGDTVTQMVGDREHIYTLKRVDKTLLASGWVHSFLVWEGSCSDCGARFECSGSQGMNRRCPAHRRPGLPTAKIDRWASRRAAKAAT